MTKLIVILLVSLCSLVWESFAVSYNGSSAFSLPSVTRTSDNYLVYYQDNFAQYTYIDETEWVNTRRQVLYLKWDPWSTYSWVVTSLLQWGTVWTNYLYMRLSYDSSIDTIYMDFYSDSYWWWSWNNYLPWTYRNTIEIVDSWIKNTCVWLAPECWLFISFLYTSEDGILWGATTLQNVITYYIYDNDFIIKKTYETFDINIWPYLSARNWDDQGLFEYNTTSLIAKHYMLYSPHTNEERSVDLFDNFMIWDWTFNETPVEWFWASWIQTITWWTGSTGTGTGIFDDCWFLEVWCYLEAIWGQITWFFDYLFPEISFSGSADTCMSWSISSTGSYMQKFANIIAIINPIPPDEWSVICTLFWTWLVDYQSAIGTGNFFTVYAHGAVPAYLEWDWRVIWDQTILDIIVIFTCMILIFYRRSQND